MAPQVGLDPTTLRLTAGCSAIELLRSVVVRALARPLGNRLYHSISSQFVKTTRPVTSALRRPDHLCLHPKSGSLFEAQPLRESPSLFLLRYGVGLATPLRR